MSAHVVAEAAPRKPRVPLNGVNTPALFATIDVVSNQPQLAEFQFRAKSDWVGGTHMKTTMSEFSGAGGEHSHKAAYTVYADHPPVLCGEDNGPTPVEYVLHALAACLTAGIANIAAARGVTLHSVKSSLSRATWTCAASSACPTRYATASVRSASASTSRATRRRKAAGDRRAVARAFRRLRHPEPTASRSRFDTNA